MRLTDAIRLQRGDRVALVGAGGKTSAMFRLADELRREGWRVVTTTTTHVAQEQLEALPEVIWLSGTQDISPVLQALDRSGVAMVVGPSTEARARVGGPPPEVLDALASRLDVDAILIEADGSRQLPLKAPAEHEPAIPEFADLVVVVVGYRGLGQPLDADHVHRPERFSVLAGMSLGAPVSAEAVARVLSHREGGLRRVPPGARAVALINQVDREADLEGSRRLARQVLAEPGMERVAIASMRREDPVWEVHGRVGGVILAAGASSRLGQPKALLPWKGITVIGQVVAAASAMGLDDVVVVAGEHVDAIGEAVGRQARVVYNREWALGQSRSVRLGLSVLRADVAAALFMLGDQPGIDPAVGRQVIERWRQTGSPIVAPRYRGQRGHPVLFDRCVFPELMALEGDVGGRLVIERHVEHVAWVDIDGPSPPDIDTWEGYQRALTEGDRVD